MDILSPTTTFSIFCRFSIVGNYNKYECGIRINDVIDSDAGAWECELIEYKNKFEQLYSTPKRSRRSFEVKVFTNFSTAANSTTAGGLPPWANVTDKPLMEKQEEVDTEQ